MTVETGVRREIRNAEIIAVGSELLTPSRIDTNSLFITERLNEVGITVRAKAIVGDDRDDLATLFLQALGRVDLIVLTGGLGPTDDDLTRDVVARVLGLPLEENAHVLEHIRSRFALRKLAMPEINRRQAMVPRGAAILSNPNGTAPGLWIESGEKVVVLLPGPPREMRPMLESVLRDRLQGHTGSARLFRRTLLITGRTESHVEELAQPIYSRWIASDRPIQTTILASLGQIELHLTARASIEAEARALLDEAATQLLGVLGNDVFSTDGRPLEAVVGDALRAKGWRIAIAESCTGGLLASRVTEVPGSSDYAELAVVTYSNRSKTQLAGVPEPLIREHGAVSEPVASAMAQGIRERAGVEVGVGITGIAGPAGGSDEKPVGTVMIAVSAPEGVRARAFRFHGGRAQVRFQATQAALDMVRRLLMETDRSDHAAVPRR
jgi:nicotinamide-nucleotide amidase